MRKDRRGGEEEGQVLKAQTAPRTKRFAPSVARGGTCQQKAAHTKRNRGATVDGAGFSDHSTWTVKPPVIIPAAGLGTRLRPLTHTTPKELLPLGGEPAILGALLEAEAAGVDEIIVVVGPGKASLESWLHEQMDRRRWPMRIRLARQPAPLGVIDAVERGRAVAGHPTRYVVLFPDYVHLPEQRGLAQLLSAADGQPGTWLGLLRRTPDRHVRMGRTAAVWTEPMGTSYRVVDVGSCGATSAPHHTTFAVLRCPQHQEMLEAGNRDDTRVEAILGRLAAARLLFGVELSPEVLDLGVRPGYDDAVARFSAGARWRSV